MDATWNPVRGCALVSPGCEHCYAERQAHRFSGKGKAYEGLTVLGKHGPRWAGHARFIPEMLDAPLRWKRPRRVFVNSMSDLFHEDITDEQIAAIFGVMAACPMHTFQALTKRPERMLEWFAWLGAAIGHNERLGTRSAIPCDPLAGCQIQASSLMPPAGRKALLLGSQRSPEWPLPNVWLGTSCEDQQRADERIPLLLQCPAAIRFVSLEPLLGPINVRPWIGLECVHEDAYVEPDTNAVICRECDDAALLDWVIAGGESGPGARPCHVEWIRAIVQQCADAGVACFVKQLGAVFARSVAGDAHDSRDRKGGDPSEWPEPLRVRQYPEVHP